MSASLELCGIELFCGVLGRVLLNAGSDQYSLTGMSTWRWSVISCSIVSEYVSLRTQESLSGVSVAYGYIICSAAGLEETLTLLLRVVLLFLTFAVSISKINFPRETFLKSKICFILKLSFRINVLWTFLMNFPKDDLQDIQRTESFIIIIIICVQPAQNPGFSLPLSLILSLSLSLSFTHYRSRSIIVLAKSSRLLPVYRKSWWMEASPGRLISSRVRPYFLAVLSMFYPSFLGGLWNRR